MAPAGDLRERVLAALDAHTDGHPVLLFHPFLLDAAPDALSVVADVLARAAEAAALPRHGRGGRRLGPSCPIPPLPVAGPHAAAESRPSGQ